MSRFQTLASIFAVTVLVLVAAEGLARFSRSLALRRDGLASPPSRTALSELSEQQWQDYDRFPYAELKPYVAFGPAANYRSPTLNTNELGLRGRPVAVPKPSGTIRITVLGGSAAFGTGASSDAATIPAQLEEALHVAGRREIEVVNAAAPGYISGQELAKLTFEVLDLQPDAVIIYDGFNDLNSPLMFERRPGYPSGFSWLERAAHFNSVGRVLAYRTQHFLHQSGLSFWARRARGLQEGALLAPPEADAEIIATYSRHLDTMVWLAQARGAKVVCAFQPTLFAKKYPTSGEQAVLDFVERRHPGYSKRLRELLPRAVAAMRKVAAARGVVFLDLSAIFDDIPGTIFFDTAHVTDEGNRVIAERLRGAVETLL